MHARKPKDKRENGFAETAQTRDEPLGGPHVNGGSQSRHGRTLFHTD
jgi:hypothetical protein